MYETKSFIWMNKDATGAGILLYLHLFRNNCLANAAMSREGEYGGLHWLVLYKIVQTPSQNVGIGSSEVIYRLKNF